MFFFQRSYQEWLARERRCLCQMFPHFCPGFLDWVALAGRIIFLLLQELPKGSEKGKFLSLDLGGTNFRVIFMELTKDKVKQCSLLNV